MSLDPDRGTGRTTRMLERALAHRNSAGHRPLIVIANAGQIPSVRRLALEVGFERTTDVLLVLATNPRALCGASPCDVFVDHYVADALSATEWSAFWSVLRGLGPITLEF